MGGTEKCRQGNYNSVISAMVEEAQDAMDISPGLRKSQKAS